MSTVEAVKKPFLRVKQFPHADKKADKSGQTRTHHRSSSPWPSTVTAEPASSSVGRPRSFASRHTPSSFLLLRKSVRCLVVSSVQGKTNIINGGTIQLRSE